jgi:cytosine/adenosine deaminase-related metal-dependent hydrolase
MRHFSAQYIITNEGPPIKRGIVSVNDDGTIAGVTDTGGDLRETGSVEFHNGIIIPGFVNCHCHLELSHMKDLIPSGNGLADFLRVFRDARMTDIDRIKESARTADAEMYSNGIELCADICNTNHTFGIKQQSRIRYKNLIEVFGIDPSKAEKRMNEAIQLANEAESSGLEYSVVPHAVYSISLPLFRMLHSRTASNVITSIHFMETSAEQKLLEKHEGPLMDSYRESELVAGLETLELVSDHSTAVLEYITGSGNLILVHNTFAGKEIIAKLKKRENIFWCLCPKANLYIENNLPPLDTFINEGCTLVTGTDSYASNNKLDILDEIRTLQDHFPEVKLTDLVRYATINGAEALGEQNIYGSVKPGKRPGLLLLRDVDLSGMRLLPETNVSRLI